MKIPQFKVEDGMIVQGEDIEVPDDHDCYISPEDGCDHPSHIKEIIPELDDEVIEETF